MVDIPNVKAAEPIPSQVMSEITDLMSNGDRNIKTAGFRI